VSTRGVTKDSRDAGGGETCKSLRSQTFEKGCGFVLV
jgi:hypothetical protein